MSSRPAFGAIQVVTPGRSYDIVIGRGTLFHEVIVAGGSAALITPYPERYFEAIESGRRLLSSVPLSAVNAGVTLMGADDLRAGRAVSPDFTGAGWRHHLGYEDVPLLSLPDAGRQIASIAAGQMMLEHLGETKAAAMLDQALADFLGSGVLPGLSVSDIKKAGMSTSKIGDAICERIQNMKS